MPKRIAICFFLVACAGLSCAIHRAVNSSIAPLGVPLRGMVLFPDGTPAAGAIVKAESDCPKNGFTLVNDAVVTSDGSFMIPSFDDMCARVRFTASYPSEYWLPTGQPMFCLAAAGTSPEVEIGDRPVDPVSVILGVQGGEVEIRVFDTSSNRFVFGGLYVRPLCGDEGKGRTSMGTATAKDGGPSRHLLPAGRYRVQLDQFRCNGKVYFPATPPGVEFEVTAAHLTPAVIRVDLSQVDTKSSYDNVEARRCSN